MAFGLYRNYVGCLLKDLNDNRITLSLVSRTSGGDVRNKKSASSTQIYFRNPEFIIITVFLGCGNAKSSVAQSLLTQKGAEKKHM